MKNINTIYAINLRNNVSQIQGLLNLAIILAVIAGFMYLTFYTVAMSDKYILETGAPFLEPLAKFLNPNNTAVEIYKLTAFKLFISIVPIFLIQYIISQIEDNLLDQYNFKEEKKSMICSSTYFAIQ